jgi:hypothetical protein
MTLQTKIFNSGTFKAVCSAIGFVSFSIVSFFVAVFVITMTSHSVAEQLRISDTAYSPDGKLKAVVFAHPQYPECKNVSVVSAQSQLEKTRVGNVFSERCTHVSAKWQDNQRLIIYCDSATQQSEPLNFIAFDRGVEIDIRELKGK